MAAKSKRSHHPKARRKSFVLVEHPFSNLDPAIIQEALARHAREQAKAFPTLADTLFRLIRQYYPPHILSLLCVYGLQVGVSDEGVDQTSTHNEIQQHHVELFQALVLTVPLPDWGTQPIPPKEMQSAIDTIKSLTEAFHDRRFVAATELETPEQRAIAGIQERIRLHTQVVRNWGFFSQVVRIAAELYGALDRQFEDAFGFTATQLISTCHDAVRLLEKRSNERHAWLRYVIRERKVPRMLRAYQKYCPFIGDDFEKLAAEVPRFAIREQVATHLMTHADTALPALMDFTPQALSETTGITPEKSRLVLDALSASPGYLMGRDIEHFFMANPIWASPFIKLNKSYFCCAPQSALSHIHDVMKSLAHRAKIKLTLDKRRARYLEDKVRTLLENAMTMAIHRHDTKWPLGDKVYETDHLALLDKTVVIVEDKSPALTDRGLRGAPERVKRHIEQLVIEPSEQSARLEAIVRRAADGDAAARKVLEPFNLDFSQVQQVVRISVTLDDFSVVSSAEADLKETGWIPKDVELPATMNLADLESAIEILGSSAFFIHYFAERERIQKSVSLFADEMDMLGLYLQTGFNSGAFDQEKLHLALTGMSAAIDHYYESADAGVRLKRPSPLLPPYFSKLIGTLEERHPVGWTIITTALLRCGDHDELRTAERRLEELRKMVERDWRDPDHMSSLVIIPPTVRDTVVVFFAFPQQLAYDRRKLAEAIAAQVMDKNADRKKCVVISRNTSLWDQPYAGVMLSTRK